MDGGKIKLDRKTFAYNVANDMFRLINHLDKDPSEWDKNDWHEVIQMAGELSSVKAAKLDSDAQKKFYREMVSITMGLFEDLSRENKVEVKEAV